MLSLIAWEILEKNLYKMFTKFNCTRHGYLKLLKSKELGLFVFFYQANKYPYTLMRLKLKAGVSIRFAMRWITRLSAEDTLWRREVCPIFFQTNCIKLDTMQTFFKVPHAPIKNVLERWCDCHSAPNVKQIFAFQHLSSLDTVSTSETTFTFKLFVHSLLPLPIRQAVFFQIDKAFDLIPHTGSLGRLGQLTTIFCVWIRNSR
jgi:hypothetical protein